MDFKKHPNEIRDKSHEGVQRGSRINWDGGEPVPNAKGTRTTTHWARSGSIEREPLISPSSAAD